MRMMQALLVVAAAGLLVFAGYSWGRVAGIDEAQRIDEFDTPRAPSAAEVIVPAILGIGCLVGAFLLQAGPGVRLPTPARLEQMRGRDHAPDAAPESDERADSDTSA